MPSASKLATGRPLAPSGPMDASDPAPADAFAPIDFRSELNDEQYAAVTESEGPALVLAGAGSGKTRTLTYRVAYLLHQGVRPTEILLLTFTNKAAREMLQRVEDLSGVPRRYLWGGTFHSFGQRVLRTQGEAIGLKRHYTILDEGEAETVLKNALNEADPQFLKGKNNPKPKAVRNLISYVRNTRGSVAAEAGARFFNDPAIADAVARAHEIYQRMKLEQQVADYDDLLELLLRLFREHPDIAGHYQDRFRHILVDEFQDTNQLQSDIVDTLATRHQVMAVGDDAQCIYTWRGANFDNIMRFGERHAGASVHRIETNYRSSPEILAFANSVLNAQPTGRGYDKELRPVRESREKPRFIPIMDSRGQAAFVIEQLQNLVDEGRSLSEIAVLYRAHYQAMDLQMELTRRHIDYEITSGVRFFEQAHVKDFTAQLRFAANPADASAFLRLAALLPKVGPKTAEKIHRETRAAAEKEERDFLDVLVSDAIKRKVPAGAREEWPSLAETLRELGRAVQKGESPERVVRLALDGWYGDYIRQVYADHHEREDDLQSLIGFAERYETMEELLAQLVLLASETTERSPEERKNCLRLSTIHQAKGLEFPVVFVIGLADGLFPLRRAIEDDNLEEERRLFYVAVTRAMDDLYLCYPMINQQGGGMTKLDASRFIQEVSPDRFETVRVTRPTW